MTIARSQIVDVDADATYLCTMRCVRRSFLFGTDRSTGKNYDHRKDWIVDRAEFLCTIFAAEMTGYSIMINHFHIGPHMIPARAKAWPDEEVARRWLTLCPPRPPREGETAADVFAAAMARLLRNKRRLKVLRRRLHDLSWFMRELDEYIARKANREDGCKGRFWEGRFDAKLLANPAAVLAGLVYVDLNPVRAGVAATPETSGHTSVQARVAARAAAEKLELLAAAETASAQGEAPAAGAAAVVERERERAAHTLRRHQWLPPIQKDEAGRGVFRQLTLDEYLTIVDHTGRALKEGKPGVIAAELAPILERLSLRTEAWVDSMADFDKRFRRILGRVEEIKAQARRVGRRWFQGVEACRALFAPAPAG